jgi:hypothetical protein
MLPPLRKLRMRCGQENLMGSWGYSGIEMAKHMIFGLVQEWELGSVK